MQIFSNLKYSVKIAYLRSLDTHVLSGGTVSKAYQQSPARIKGLIPRRPVGQPSLCMFQERINKSHMTKLSN